MCGYFCVGTAPIQILKDEARVAVLYGPVMEPGAKGRLEEGINFWFAVGIVRLWMEEELGLDGGGPFYGVFPRMVYKRSMEEEVENREVYEDRRKQLGDVKDF
jgi:hypothetical protein